jgi:FtsZ-binding cell division protein ZapB
MENSITELSNIIPMDGMPMSTHTRGGSKGSLEDADAAHLRAIIREKNEKISMLTAEFDAHRADFRSTIDTLEMASTETERVYEKRVEELMQENRELQEGRDDFASVANQLKQLEELVQELEEGLEDARRGEAEARGEVEFLRGEVERGRSELRREREKASEALKNANAAAGSPGGARETRDLEQRDDEIRGLKAIIHSLSSGGDMGTQEAVLPTLHRTGTFPSSDGDDMQRVQANVERLEREKKELQGLVERKSYREEELEREIERLKGDQRGSVISNGFSDRTAIQEKRSSGRDSKGTINWRGSSGAVKQDLPHVEETESPAPSTAGSGVLWCEICETNGHDILTCTSMDKTTTKEVAPEVVTPKANRYHSSSISSQDPDKPKPLSTGKKSPLPPLPGAAPTAPLPNPFDASLVAGKDGSKPDPNKWCALCERDGHDSINCAFEDQF